MSPRSTIAVASTGRVCGLWVACTVLCLVIAWAVHHLLFKILLINGRVHDENTVVLTQMRAVIGEIRSMTLEGVKVPRSIEGIIEHARAHGDIRNTVVARLDGCDPWGSPYYVDAVLDHHYCGDGCYRITVRSFGPNRRDELGKGDDIQLNAPGFPP